MQDKHKSGKQIWKRECKTIALLSSSGVTVRLFYAVRLDESTDNSEKK